MKMPIVLLVAAALLATRLEASSPPPASQGAAVPAGLQQAEVSELGTAGLAARTPTDRDWILKTADNICGLRDPNQLTHPAVIDYEACLEATPEMRRIRDQGIDPKSAAGIQLRTAAVNRLSDACESVRASNGHCSVWKEIRHKDGRSIPDVSSQVIALF